MTLSLSAPLGGRLNSSWQNRHNPPDNGFPRLEISLASEASKAGLQDPDRLGPLAILPTLLSRSADPASMHRWHKRNWHDLRLCVERCCLALCGRLSARQPGSVCHYGLVKSTRLGSLAARKQWDVAQGENRHVTAGEGIIGQALLDSPAVLTSTAFSNDSIQ